MKKNTEVATVASQNVMNQLSASYPVEQAGLSIILPRLGMVSQDVTEKNGKTIKVVTEAGTFYIEKQGEDTDEEGKQKWEREEIGTELEGIIFFKRHQLKLYDEATESFISSPIYDNADEVIPLFQDKKQIAKGTPAELKAIYQYTDQDTGKIKSKLEDNRILYVLVNEVMHQLNLRGSSMYSFLNYEKTVPVPTVVTHFSSTSEKKGKIEWNKMKFDIVRKISDEEGKTLLHEQNRLKKAIEISKASFSTPAKKSKDGLDEFEAKSKEIEASNKKF